MTRKDRIYPFFFAALCLYAFAPQYFSDKIIAWLDMAHYFLPFRELTAEAVRQGVMPMWNPYIYCGNPLIANMQSAVFYPLSLFFYILPPDAAVRGITFAAFFIMSFSFYHLARLYRVSEEGSLLSAVVFSFSFFMMVKAPELADLHVMAWLPASLYFMKKHLAEESITDAVLSGLCLALSFLGGHPQVFLYVFLLYLAVFVYEAACNKKGIMKSLRAFTVIMAVPFFAAVFQAAVTLKFIMLSKRADAGLSAAEIKSSYMGAWHGLMMFFTFIAPYVKENIRHLNWSGLVTIGPSVAALFLGGIFFGREKKLTVFLTVLGIVSLFLSFLGAMPFFDLLLEKMPFLKTMRYPSKINVIFLFSAALLCGAGFDAVFGDDREKSRKMGVFSAVLLGVLAAGFAALAALKEPIIKIYSKTIPGAMTLQQAYDAVISYNDLLARFGFYLLIFSAAAAVIYLSGVKGMKSTALKLALVLLAAAAESHYSNKNYSYYDDISVLNGPSKSMLFMKQQPGNPRVLAPNVYDRFDMGSESAGMRETIQTIREVMLPNAPMSARILNADGFDSLVLGSHFRFRSYFSALDAPWEMPAFALFSADYIASVAPVQGRGLRQEYRGKGYIYRNYNSASKAFFVPDSVQIAYTDSHEEIKQILHEPGFDPYYSLAVESKAGGSAKKNQKPHRGYAAGYELVDLNTVKVTVKNDVPGFAVLTDNYYPGWKAFVNGAETPVYRAFGTYKAVIVGAGDNTVIFRYTEERLHLMLAAAFGFLLFLSGAAVFLRRRLWNY